MNAAATRRPGALGFPLNALVTKNPGWQPLLRSVVRYQTTIQKKAKPVSSKHATGDSYRSPSKSLPDSQQHAQSRLIKSADFSPRNLNSATSKKPPQNPESSLASTRPAHIDAPAEPSATEHDGSVPLKARASYYYQLGKAYLTFYKTGLKNVWANSKEAKAIRQRYQIHPRRVRETLVLMAKYGGQKLSEQKFYQSKVPLTDKVKREDGLIPAISRREYQLCLRTRKDIIKVIPFGLILAVFGEWTPLVIVFASSSFVPSTCRIPHQVRRDQERPFRLTPRIRFEKAKLVQQRYPEAEQNPTRLAHDFIDRVHTLKAYAVGVSPISTPLPIPVLGALWTRFITLPRLRRWGRETVADMTLIRREGGYANLEPVEVFECVLRQWNAPGLTLIGKLLAGDPRKDPVQPDSEQLKNQLVPLLERQADRVLAKNKENTPKEANADANANAENDEPELDCDLLFDRC